MGMTPKHFHTIPTSCAILADALVMVTSLVMDAKLNDYLFKATSNPSCGEKQCYHWNQGCTYHNLPILQIHN